MHNFSTTNSAVLITSFNLEVTDSELDLNSTIEPPECYYQLSPNDDTQYIPVTNMFKQSNYLCWFQYESQNYDKVVNHIPL